MRDVLLAVLVFRMQSPKYTGVTLLVAGCRNHFQALPRRRNAHAIHLRRHRTGSLRGLGIEKSFLAQYPAWVAIVMGIITGSFGGITRDIPINEEPIFFRKDIYATACLAGGLVYWFTTFIPSTTPLVAQIACAVTVIGLHIAAITFRLVAARYSM